jgi:hypothetical protein
MPFIPCMVQKNKSELGFGRIFGIGGIIELIVIEDFVLQKNH